MAAFLVFMYLRFELAHPKLKSRILVPLVVSFSDYKCLDTISEQSVVADDAAKRI